MTENEKLDLILSEIQGMKSDIQGMKSDIQEMKSEIEGTKNEIQEMKSDIQEIKQKVTKIDLTIDNELRVNIQRIAEGHLDLSRNLHDAMKPSNEIEMLAIKVRMLESDVRDLKEKLA